MTNVLKRMIKPPTSLSSLDPVSHLTDKKYGMDIAKHNPVSAYKNAKKSGAGTKGTISHVLDPAGVMGDSLADTPEESAAFVAKARERVKERKASGMKKGGKTKMRPQCRGMGSATRGGGYGK